MINSTKPDPYAALIARLEYIGLFETADGIPQLCNEAAAAIAALVRERDAQKAAADYYSQEHVRAERELAEVRAERKCTPDETCGMARNGIIQNAMQPVVDWLHKWPGGAPNEAWSAISQAIAAIDAARSKP